MDKKIKDPQIFISKEARELFRNMSRRYDEFKGLDNKDLFMLAVIFGYRKGKNSKKNLRKQEKATSGFTRERYLHDNDNSILKAIAVAEEGNVEFISGNRIPEVYSIAEGYANGGIKDLKEFVFENPASFVKKFSNMLKREVQKSCPSQI